MTAPINLNKLRKARDKAADKAAADANAVKHGLTKSERLRQARLTALNAKRLDSLQFEDD